MCIVMYIQHIEDSLYSIITARYSLALSDNQFNKEPPSVYDDAAKIIKVDTLHYSVHYSYSHYMHSCAVAS